MRIQVTLKLRTDLLQIRPVDKPGEEVVHLLVAAQVLPLVTHPPLKHSETGKLLRIGEYSSLSLRLKSWAIFFYFWLSPGLRRAGWLRHFRYLASCTILDNSVSPVSASGTTKWSNSLFPRALEGVLYCEQIAARVPPVHQVATTGRAYLTMCKLIHQWADPFWNRGTHLSKSLHFLWRKIKETKKGLLCAPQEQLSCWAPDAVETLYFTTFSLHPFAKSTLTVWKEDQTRCK